jgi:hypothetical protein
MLGPDALRAINTAIARQRADAEALMKELREDVRTVLSPSTVIRPHSTTAVSFAASDSATNGLVFDPFRMELIRVVDSQGHEGFLDVISPRTDPDELDEHHRGAGDPMCVLMNDLEVDHLSKLSPMIPSGKEVREEPDRVKSSWTRDYRDLVEWAVLYHRIKSFRWATDTLIVCNGLLRSKIFTKDLFARLGQLIFQEIERHHQNGIKIFLVGIAQRSGVLARYRLAMALENAMPVNSARFVRVPRSIEQKVYKWKEYARGVEDEDDTLRESPKFVIGSMFLVRFGREAHDPIWAIDVLERQADQAGEIFGYLLQDAIEGFPVPYYPRCLQRAHEHAQVIDFDLDVLQDAVARQARDLIEPDKRAVFDGMMLVPGGPAADQS